MGQIHAPATTFHPVCPTSPPQDLHDLVPLCALADHQGVHMKRLLMQKTLPSEPGRGD